MKAILRKYDDDGETISVETVVASISDKEENIDERILWVEVPTGLNEDKIQIEIDVCDIFDHILDKLGLKKS